MADCWVALGDGTACGFPGRARLGSAALTSEATARILNVVAVAASESRWMPGDGWLPVVLILVI